MEVFKEELMKKAKRKLELISKENINLSKSKQKNNNINPNTKALRITIIYIIFGSLWIIITDHFLHSHMDLVNSHIPIALHKGLLFVILSGSLIYVLLRKVLVDYNGINKELISVNRKLGEIAFYHPLTKLLNREGLALEVEKLINGKDANKTMALLYMDIDNFKYVNDTLGHDVGDRLIKHVATIIKSNIKWPNIIGHISSDDFVLFFPDTSREEMVAMVDGFQDLFRRPWLLEKIEIYLTTSIGIALYPDDGKDFSTLYKNAEIAMYYTKKIKKDSYAFYSRIIAYKILHDSWIANEIRRALINQEFMPFYQPIIDLTTGEIFGLEVLARWEHRSRGWISPEVFIPVAETNGLIYGIDIMMFQKAMEQVKIWGNSGYHLNVFVNISSITIRNSRLVADTKEIIDEYGSFCEGIQFEITETVAIKDLGAAINTMNRIKELGIKFALDDFGTGYSSLNCLKSLPIDLIKLDASFIRNIEDENQVEEIIDTIIRLGHILDKKIIAEGIETSQQLKYLVKHGCDLGQGFLFARPLLAIDFDKLLCENGSKMEV